MAQNVDIEIRGMSCASCVGRVERALSQQPGVINAQVNLATQKAAIQVEAVTTTTSLLDAIETSGLSTGSGKYRDSCYRHELRILCLSDRANANEAARHGGSEC